MAKATTVSPTLLALMKEKASSSSCTYKVCAFAFDRKGDLLGHAVNRHSRWDVLQSTNQIGRPGTAMHAEHRLMARYQGHVATILLCRVGHSGDLLPIDPCPKCKKVAEKLGVKIVSIKP